jgi:hypothetical protein
MSPDSALVDRLPLAAVSCTGCPQAWLLAKMKIMPGACAPAARAAC